MEDDLNRSCRWARRCSAWVRHRWLLVLAQVPVASLPIPPVLASPLAVVATVVAAAVHFATFGRVVMICGRQSRQVREEAPSSRHRRLPCRLLPRRPRRSSLPPKPHQIGSWRSPSRGWSSTPNRRRTYRRSHRSTVVPLRRRRRERAASPDQVLAPRFATSCLIS